MPILVDFKGFPSIATRSQYLVNYIEKYGFQIKGKDLLIFSKY